MKSIIAMIMTVCCIAAAQDAKEPPPQTLQEIFSTFPTNLIQKGRLNKQLESAANLWMKDQAGKKVKIVMRTDRGSKTGKCSVEIQKKVYYVSVNCNYSGEWVKGRAQYKPRRVKCKDRKKTHLVHTRTGKEVTVYGTISVINVYPNLCGDCGRPEYLRVHVKVVRFEK